ncbi:MAG: EpsD family peptidyl-prolyl cis-trans isomerase [Burkholderiales bacterium]
MAVVGCGGQTPDQSASQIAAKVNGYEITVHQINFALSQLGAVPKEQIKAASNQILDRLVEQQILVEQALALKIDRDPKAVQAIEAARRQILAQAYLDRVLADVGKGTADDVKRFYDQHPELFSERRIYRLQEINLAADPAIVDPLKERVGKAKSLNEVVTWMQSEKIAFATNLTTRAAEQLPMKLGQEFHKMKQGQIAIVPNAANVTVSQIAAVQEAPLDMPQAMPYIERYLDNQKRMGRVEQKLKELRGSAKIEFSGDFGSVQTVSTPAHGNTVPSAAAEAFSPAAPVAGARATDKGSSDAFMEKGLSGLR